MSERASTRGYAEQATMLIARYESIVPEEVHEKVLHLFPEGPCRTLDIGAGSGRDAAWFAAKGHTVVAVEPTAEMREAGMRLHPDPNIEWVDDDLPDLAALADDAPFDLITLTAVWQHLDADERKQGMARLAALARRDAVVAAAASARPRAGGPAHVSGDGGGNGGARRGGGFRGPRQHAAAGHSRRRAG